MLSDEMLYLLVDIGSLRIRLTHQAELARCEVMDLESTLYELEDRLKELEKREKEIYGKQ